MKSAAAFVPNLSKSFSISLRVGLRLSQVLCYTVRMMIKEAIYKVTFKWSEQVDFVKARDEAHALRIASRWGVIESVEFSCEDCE